MTKFINPDLAFNYLLVWSKETGPTNGSRRWTVMNRISVWWVFPSLPACKFGITVGTKPKLALLITVCSAVLFSLEVSLWKHGFRLLMARTVCAIVRSAVVGSCSGIALMYSCSILNYPYQFLWLCGSVCQFGQCGDLGVLRPACMFDILKCVWRQHLLQFRLFQVVGDTHCGQYFYSRYVVGSYYVLCLVYDNLINVCK
jgi:hypothetical protein